MTERKVSASRRLADRIAIGGDYQFRAITTGRAPQRFWHEAKLREAERWIRPSPGDIILDVGCGSGVLAWRLAQAPGTHVIGIDANRAAISFASEQFRQPNLEYRLGLVDELGLAANSISKIAFIEVIEHIHPPQALEALKCFYRILEPGGRLVISTPNAGSLWPLIERTMDALRLAPHMADDQHVASYSRRSLEALGVRADLTPVTHRTINFAAPWLAMLSWRAAEIICRLETLRPQPLGSLLFMIFEKRPAEARSG
jgi:2-polyprenyl-3-methyl-5-hydroxy-6-metoxy-1,4-benzoquinol methylase